MGLRFNGHHFPLAAAPFVFGFAQDHVPSHALDEMACRPRGDPTCIDARAILWISICVGQVPDRTRSLFLSGYFIEAMVIAVQLAGIIDRKR
ncbi:hypothetical protein VFPFJ_06660 [Purpureocillium lilacinum]|uniref:Uncharacterized protein n=1 Tax=Purpureocillium lilacinum TaxID=33203 RepID=A0A179GSD4_PURLI|nr:hypothetical protein VFPFJ_06660 [Purpureocillium lilacinum]OAQ80398.1 hypothetical protein VFPBJ_05983 [Purpureocillium lilacinum]OAQ88195.1 hypothetical protein VFPFJ_06660 [Purpureocillium lilacinum]PON16395.1 hypothetical protein C2W62_18740 [Candidatus Entotheonella serta]